MHNEILFKEYVFPKSHKNAGEKVFRQATPKSLRMLQRAKENFAGAKKKQPSNIIKPYSEPHEWNESPGPQNYNEVMNTVFASRAIQEEYLKRYSGNNEQKAEEKAIVPPPVVIFPEIENFNLIQLIEFGIKEFPEKEAEIKSAKYPNPLRQNLRAWGKDKVTA